MKHKVSFFAILMMALAIPQSVLAYDFSAVAPTGQTLYYNIVFGRAYVTYPGSEYDCWGGYAMPTGNITIPDSVTYGGTTYPVTSIGDYAFRDCSGVTSVTIPDGVSSIGQSAFSGCSSLTSVTIPDGVTSIKEYTFAGCTNLISITIPDGVTTIEKRAFSGCRSLTSVTIPEGVTTIGLYAFYFCNLNTLNYNATNCTSIGYLDSTNLYTTAWGNITTLNIGENVVSLPSLAFAFLTSLTTVNFNEALTTIGNSAFRNCSGLTSISIPSSVTSIGISAFRNCSGLTSITLPSSITTIDQWAFGDCSGLTSISIPSSVTSIGNSAFRNCSGLTSISIPSSVTSIGYAAFYNCSGLTSVTLPNSITTIDQWAFGGCSGLTSISIPSSVTSIEEATFYDCSGLTSVTLPNSVTKIGRWAFRGCSGLTSITLPNSLDSISQAAFAHCSGLTSIAIPEGVTSIGGWAFSGCSGLTNVIIGSGVTSIGDSAFAGGDHIIQMTCNAAVPPTVANVNAFDDVFRGIPLYVPAASLSSYRVAYGWREFTNFIGMSTYTITATSNNPAWGTVSGGGSYGNGATATLTAMPNAGYRFVRWQDGNTENPRIVTVTSDATYIAYFEATQGIDGAEATNIHIFADNNRIVVEGAAQLPITVFDMTGRKIASMATGTQEPCSFSTQTAGVYMVRVGDLPARKIVMIK